MNKKLKKFAAMFLVLLMFIAAVPVQMLNTYAATGKITFSDPSVTVGEQVSVRMKIDTADGALGASDVRLQYDSSALEFVSGTSANGGAGSVRVIGAMEAADQKTFTFTLKFKALKAGTSTIKVTSQEVYDADSQVVTIDHVGSSAVKISAPVTYSKDASLESLTISPGELTPAFSADVTEYTAVVGTDVEKLTVSAPASHDKASVSVSGNEGLQNGENTITCKVTAEDGATTKTYTIIVTKTEETTADSTEETSEAVTAGGSATNVEEGNWQVAATFDSSLMPEGFSVTDFTYDGQTVQAAVDESGNVLLYMTNESGEDDFFLYNTENNVLAPYVTVHMAEKQIIVLPPEAIPAETSLPEGFAACTIDIGTHTVHGWIWNDASEETPEYCVVYGQNEDGECHFYRYDQKEMTMQRYFQDPDAADLRVKYEEIAKTYTELLNDYNMRGWIMAGLFAACVVLVLILIIVLLKKPKAETMEDDRDVEEFVPTARRRVQQEKTPNEIIQREKTPAPVVEEAEELETMIELDEEDDGLEIIDLDL